MCQIVVSGRKTGKTTNALKLFLSKLPDSLYYVDTISQKDVILNTLELSPFYLHHKQIDELYGKIWIFGGMVWDKKPKPYIIFDEPLKLDLLFPQWSIEDMYNYFDYICTTERAIDNNVWLKKLYNFDISQKLEEILQ
jgi:hypothetical protein